MQADHAQPASKVAFVLGGGGVLGATQVGMLRALVEAGIRADLILGTSVGAVNGAVIAADPSDGGVQKLAQLWGSMTDTGIFSDTVLSRAATLARHRTHLYSAAPFRRQLQQHLPATFEELKVPFQCVATSIERSGAHWFSSGELAEAVLASCAVPALLAPVKIGDEHFLDGGLVHSIPVGRALALGATEIYVLHVGRIERPLTPPRRAWDLGLVAFEIARRHRFHEEMGDLPADVTVHVLPSGGTQRPPDLSQLRYRNKTDVDANIERAYLASRKYLTALT